MSPLSPRTELIAFYLFLITYVIASGCGRKEATEPYKSKAKEATAKIENEATETGDYQSEEVLVRIGEEVITINDYKEETVMLPPAYRDAANLYKSQFLESLIHTRLFLQEAQCTFGLQESFLLTVIGAEAFSKSQRRNNETGTHRQRNKRKS